MPSPRPRCRRPRRRSIRPVRGLPAARPFRRGRAGRPSGVEREDQLAGHLVVGAVEHQLGPHIARRTSRRRLDGKRADRHVPQPAATRNNAKDAQEDRTRFAWSGSPDWDARVVVAMARPPFVAASPAGWCDAAKGPMRPACLRQSRGNSGVAGRLCSGLRRLVHRPAHGGPRAGAHRPRRCFRAGGRRRPEAHVRSLPQDAPCLAQGSRAQSRPCSSSLLYSVRRLTPRRGRPGCGCCRSGAGHRGWRRARARACAHRGCRRRPSDRRRDTGGADWPAAGRARARRPPVRVTVVAEHHQTLDEVLQLAHVPGHGWASSRARASGWKARSGLPLARPCMRQKWRASCRMSSPRSRNGGTQIGTTLMR